MQWADLEEADLEGANLAEAKLKKANLQRTNLRGAVLCKAVSLEDAVHLESVATWFGAKLCRSQVESIRQRYPEVAERIEGEAEIFEDC